MDLLYIHRKDGREFRLDTRQLHRELGAEVSLAEPEVILWIQDYIREQEEALSASSI